MKLSKLGTVSQSDTVKLGNAFVIHFLSMLDFSGEYMKKNGPTGLLFFALEDISPLIQKA